MVEDSNSWSECDSPRKASMYKVETAKPPVKKKWFHHLESVIEQKWKEGLKRVLPCHLAKQKSRVLYCCSKCLGKSGATGILDYQDTLSWIKSQLICWLFQQYLLPLSMVFDCRRNMHWQAKQTGRFKSRTGSYVNPLTTNEYRIIVIEIWQHGGCAIEWAWSALGGRFFCLPVRTSVENGPFTV